TLSAARRAGRLRARGAAGRAEGPATSLVFLGAGGAGQNGVGVLGIHLADADRAQAVAELRLRVLAYVDLDLLPAAPVGADLLAGGADGQQAAQHLDGRHRLVDALLQALLVAAERVGAPAVQAEGRRGHEQAAAAQEPRRLAQLRRQAELPGRALLVPHAVVV